MRDNGTRIVLTISANLNITVNDTVAGLFCSFRDARCYIECSFHNFFENENFTTSKNMFIRVENDTVTIVNFTIGKQDVIFHMQMSVYSIYPLGEIDIHRPVCLFFQVTKTALHLVL